MGNLFPFKSSLNKIFENFLYGLLYIYNEQLFLISLKIDLSVIIAQQGFDEYKSLLNNEIEFIFLIIHHPNHSYYD